MDALLEEMRQGTSVQACIALALTDAYGDDEQAVAWLTCIEAMFSRFQQVNVQGRALALVGFDLRGHTIVAVRQQGQRKARVPLDFVEFPSLTPIAQRGLNAWKQFSKGAG
jgi:hypothetical protein